MTEALDKDTQALVDGLAEDVAETEVDEELDDQSQGLLESLPEPVQKQVPGWKIHFGDIIATNIGDKTYVWRTLFWSEYKEIQRQLLKLYPVSAGADSNDMEMADMDRRFANMELTVSKCLLYPVVDLSTIGKLGPGVLFTLHQNIADASGFEPEFVEKL
jgi:hypothetical protein